MAILTASNLGQSFGAADVFDNISLSIPNDAKIGLVGPNGVGKTTLLLILAGATKPDSGTIHRARNKRIGYLPQEAAQAFNGGEKSVYDEMLSVFSELREEEIRLREMEEEMAGGRVSDEFMSQYGAALEQFELSGGYEYEVRTKQVLEGLGFDEEDRGLRLDHLSGGQKTRALLARLLLEKPDLLILDEPTNHLDVAAIEWLESNLKAWEGAVLMVSHDRYFLDRVVNTIWEMSSYQIEVYHGNYSAYVNQREERWAERQQIFDDQKERLEKELDYIRRNIAGQRTQMAKGKLSRISRELDALQRSGTESIQGKSWSQISNEIGGSRRRPMDVAEAAEAIKELQKPDGSQRSFTVEMRTTHRSGKIVIRTSNLTVGYPDKPLFTAEDLELHRLECAALIGPNGTGKTTFLKTILGKMQPLAGQIRLGASLEIGYFAQAHEGLNPDNRVIDELIRHHEMLVHEARNYLAQYLFQGDDVFKRVESLSGGERGRLALAILALEGANFLLLDEPTNHLDLPAQEMLQSVLEGFEGTILLVTHDRYLVDRLATQLWLLDDGHLRVFKGPYQEYVAERERQDNLNKEAASKEQDDYRQRKTEARAREYAERDRVARLAQVEKEITKLEARLEEIGYQIQAATNGEAFDKIKNLSLEYAAVESRLEQRMQEWEDLARE
jgi:ATP-binding cassette subfamily F protein 3